jgi:hypothetical protein
LKGPCTGIVTSADTPAFVDATSQRRTTAG